MTERVTIWTMNNKVFCVAAGGKQNRNCGHKCSECKGMLAHLQFTGRLKPGAEVEMEEVE